MAFEPSYEVPEDRRAYTLEAGPVGCLMLHGFLGSPISSRPRQTRVAAARSGNARPKASITIQLS